MLESHRFESKVHAAATRKEANDRDTIRVLGKRGNMVWQAAPPLEGSAALVNKSSIDNPTDARASSISASGPAASNMRICFTSDALDVLRILHSPDMADCC